MAAGVLSQGAAARNTTPVVGSAGIASPAGNNVGTSPTSSIPTNNGVGGTPTTTPMPTLASLTPVAPTATLATAAQSTAAPVGTAPTANASTAAPMAAINNGQIDPNDSTNAAAQLDAITNANSPYIQQATNQGYLSAAKRGLGNSSLGAGASEAAAVAAAAPLATTNAQEATAGNLQNSQLETQASEFNASQANANQQLTAQLATQNSQFNASNQTQVGVTNAQTVNAINAQTQQLTEQLNQQFLSGSQAQTLASIQGQWNSFIQSNSSAAALMQSTMNGISSILNNQNIAPDRAGDAIQAQLTLLNEQFQVMNSIEGGTGNPTGAINPSGVAVAQGSAQGAPPVIPAAPTMTGAKPATPVVKP